MKDNKIWLLVIFIPLLPILLNYILPLGNMSNIGGKDSLAVWLNFWATFSNTLIYSILTLYILYRQIQSNKIQLDWQTKHSQYQSLLSATDTFLQFFDGKITNKIFSSWLDGTKTNRECQNEMFDLRSSFISAWLKISLLLPIEDEQFRTTQKANMVRLCELFDLYIELFQVKGTGILWVEKLPDDEYNQCFKYIHNIFPSINILHDVVFEHIKFLDERKDIQYNHICIQFSDYLTTKREELNNIIDGKTTNGKP